MPTTETAPVADAKLALAQAPAVPDLVEPAPKQIVIPRPNPVVVSQVPLVSPAIVIDFCSHVLAAEIV